MSLSDLVLFSITTAAAVYFQRMASSKSKEEEKPLMNEAFVFVKPHANTEKVRDFVKSKLIDSGMKIKQELDITGEEIDAKKLIDQHYYAIASKATLLSASEIPVPTAQFEEVFGEPWSKVLAENRAVNAMEACEKFGCDTSTLNEAWKRASKSTKFGGGFYCGLVEVGGLNLYVFNAFFMTMRSNFVQPGTSIHCYVVEWNPTILPWKSFRGELLGPTDPSEGPAGSIRKYILENYADLDLKEIPNKSLNGVHASASPFEGLAEKMNWLQEDLTKNVFGKKLLAQGIAKKSIEQWTKDPQVEVNQEEKASIFDTLEDLDVDDCLQKLIELSKLN